MTTNSNNEINLVNSADVTAEKPLLAIVDRRLNGKNKSIGNRERFIRRNKDAIMDAVRRKLGQSNGTIKDIVGDGQISIPQKGISEPIFGHGQGGKREHVHPGNKDYVAGDKIERPKGGSGGKGSGKGDAGEGGDSESNDDFVFQLTKEEFMDFFFADMGLPNLIHNNTDPNITEFKVHRAGFTSSGSPSNLSVIRTMRDALARRIAMGAGPERIKQMTEKRETLRAEFNRFALSLTAPPTKEQIGENKAYLAELEEIEAKLTRAGKIPFLDPLDLVFRNLVQTPKPSAKAVMFCLMDVSGSMDEERKERAKRFYMLQHLFLEKVYGKVEVVFIRFHDKAEECNEHDFFYKAATGGTNVTNALIEMEKIRKARYSGEQWNVFGSLASDGDSFGSDTVNTTQHMLATTMPTVRHFAYLQVLKNENTALWGAMAKVGKTMTGKFSMAGTDDNFGVIEALRHLYKKTSGALSRFAPSPKAEAALVP